MRKRNGLWSSLLLLGLALGACTGAQQQRLSAVPSPAAMQSELDLARQQFIEAYAQGNAGSLSALFDEDAWFTGTVSAVWHQGQEAIKANYTRLFQNFPTSSIAFQDTRVKFYDQVTPGISTSTPMAMETGCFDMRMRDTQGQAQDTRGKYSITWVKRNAQWLIATLHSSRLPPATAGPTCR